MKYVALVYYPEDTITAMSDEEWNQLNQRCIRCVEGLTASGNYVTGQALQPVAEAVTVKMRDGEAIISDGPFAETKEQLAGFYLLEARDLNEAIRLARKIPPAQFGSIEVRPVRELPPKEPIAGE